MLLKAETNKYCPGGYDIGAISNLITWVLNFFFVNGGSEKITLAGPQDETSSGSEENDIGWPTGRER